MIRLHFGALFVVCIVLASCSGGGGDPFDASTGSMEDNKAAWAKLNESDEFQKASASYEICMNNAGYPIVDSKHPEGILLKDGTRLKPVIGQGYVLKGAYLEYTLDREKCEAESGTAEVMKKGGLGPSGPDPTGSNEQSVRIMRCVELKGWDIPEPKKLASGILVFDIDLDAEAKQAYDIDVHTCRNELFGPGSFQTQPNP